jgi:hypothetical protein
MNRRWAVALAARPALYPYPGRLRPPPPIRDDLLISRTMYVLACAASARSPMNTACLRPAATAAPFHL